MPLGNFLVKMSNHTAGRTISKVSRNVFVVLANALAGFQMCYEILSQVLSVTHRIVTVASLND